MQLPLAWWMARPRFSGSGLTLCLPTSHFPQMGRILESPANRSPSLYAPFAIFEPTKKFPGGEFKGPCMQKSSLCHSFLDSCTHSAPLPERRDLLTTESSSRVSITCLNRPWDLTSAMRQISDDSQPGKKN